MKELVIGDNGSGKTTYLENLLVDYQKEGKKVVTNLITNPNYKLNQERVAAVTENDEDEYLYTDHDINIVNNRIILVPIDKVDDTRFTELLNLMCAEGDILILDEPEFGLSEEEVHMYMHILPMLLPTYKSVHISTHNNYIHLPLQFCEIINHKRHIVTEERANEVYMGVRG